MVKIENSKRTILNLGEALLQDKGFNGFSYANIAAGLGVKNAAIHYHYPSKKDLGIAVIQRYRERFKLWINNSRVKDLSDAEKLDWFLSIYANTGADQGKVCLVGALAGTSTPRPRPEWNAASPPILSVRSSVILHSRCGTSIRSS